MLPTSINQVLRSSSLAMPSRILVEPEPPFGCVGWSTPSIFGVWRHMQTTPCSPHNMQVNVRIWNSYTAPTDMSLLHVSVTIRVASHSSGVWSTASLLQWAILLEFESSCGSCPANCFLWRTPASILLANASEQWLIQVAIQFCYLLMIMTKHRMALPYHHTEV